MNLTLNVLVLLLSASAGHAIAADLPRVQVTPGVARVGVSAADLCPIAHTPALRDVGEAEKKQVYRLYGLEPLRNGTKLNFHVGYCSSKEGCEVDHLISLELGGANDINNLWPEPYDGTPWNAHIKDKIENKLHTLVCSGDVTLADAQHMISTDWIGAYKKYISSDPH